MTHAEHWRSHFWLSAIFSVTVLVSCFMKVHYSLAPFLSPYLSVDLCRKRLCSGGASRGTQLQLRCLRMPSNSSCQVPPLSVPLRFLTSFVRSLGSSPLRGVRATVRVLPPDHVGLPVFLHRRGSGVHLSEPLPVLSGRPAAVLRKGTFLRLNCHAST